MLVIFISNNSGFALSQAHYLGREEWRPITSFIGKLSGDPAFKHSLPGTYQLLST